jgi:hypothetical protein
MTLSWRAAWRYHRGLSLHGAQLRLAGGDSDPAGVICTVMDGPYRLPCRIITGCPDRSCPAAQLRADGISSCCYIVNVHNHP